MSELKRTCFLFIEGRNFFGKRKILLEKCVSFHYAKSEESGVIKRRCSWGEGKITLCQGMGSFLSFIICDKNIISDFYGKV